MNEPIVAPVESPTVEAPPTLAEHRSSFPSEPKEGTPEANAAPVDRQQPRRRARSHQAEADDVPEIAALTKRLREAEEAIPIERKAGESDRVFQLRRRAEIADKAREAAARSDAPKPAVAAAPRAAAQTPAHPPLGEFTEKEPTLDQYAKDADPYAAWQRALARYDRRKDEFDARRESTQATVKAQEEAFDRDMATEMQAHGKRFQSFAQQHPEAKALFEAEAAKPDTEQINITLAMRGAMEFHEKGPEMMLALLKAPDLADELFLLTNGRAIGDPRTDSLVATVRRRLLQRVSGVTSGSPTLAPKIKVAPRPPNPERTVPQTPRDKTPSDAPGSLADHRRQYPATS